MTAGQKIGPPETVNSVRYHSVRTYQSWSSNRPKRCQKMCAKPSVTLSAFSTVGGLTRLHRRFPSELGGLSHSVGCVTLFLLTKMSHCLRCASRAFGSLGQPPHGPQKNTLALEAEFAILLVLSFCGCSNLKSRPFVGTFFLPTLMLLREKGASATRGWPGAGRDWPKL